MNTHTAQAHSLNSNSPQVYRAIALLLILIIRPGGGGECPGLINRLVPNPPIFSDNGNGIGRSLTNSRPFIEEAFRSFGAASGLGAEVDLLLSKYAAALESEECMDRIICELGVNASGLQGKELFFR